MVRIEALKYHLVGQVGSFTSWARLANVDALIKLAPTLGATALLLAAMKLAPFCAGMRPRIFALLPTDKFAEFFVVENPQPSKYLNLD